LIFNFGALIKSSSPLVPFNGKCWKNGLGTRGVMIAPYVAKQLFDFIEKEKPLDREINISRFS